MAEDLNIHHCALAMGTEGYFGGSTDICVPHWPGYASGVTISMGFDIGASAITAQELTDVMTLIGVPSKMIDLLTKTVNITGEAANAKLKELKLKELVRISQQQALDLFQVVKVRFQNVTRKYFSKSYGTMHPAIIEALTKLAYGAPALLAGSSKWTFKGLGPLFDSKMAALGTDEKAQFELSMDMMDAVIAGFGSESLYPRSAKGIKGFLKKAQSVILAGGKVNVDYEPLTPEKLQDPNNKTLDVAAMISVSIHGGTVEGTAKYMRDKTKQHYDNQATKMQETCQRIGSPVPQIGGGTKMTPEVFERSVQAYMDVSPTLLKAQEKLVKLGYYDKAGISGGMKNADGTDGKNTKKVLEMYQKDNPPLPVTGTLDNETKKKLLGAVVNPAPNPNPNPNPAPNNGGDTQGWWDKIMEMYTAASKDAKLAAQSWWSPVLALYNGGSVGFAAALLTGNVTALLTEAYTKYQQYQQQQQQNDALKQQLQSAFQGKGTISGKVGKGGDNKAMDVYIVRGLLYKAGYMPQTLQQIFATPESKAQYAKSDTELENAIRKYQTEVVKGTVDGRIDPDGKTIKALNGSNAPANTNNNPAPVTPEAEPSFQPVALDAAVFPCFN